MNSATTKKMKITDMCIWIDAHAYEENVDKNQLFEYLYNIAISISIKNKLLPQWSDYEPFALYLATQAYLRLINPKQFLPDDDPKKMKKVKSILNYIKRIMYPMIVNYQKQNFAQRFENGINEDLDNCHDKIRHELHLRVKKQNSQFMGVEFEHCLKSISFSIKQILKTTPYVKDKLMMHQLYQSCLLTLLNQFTLSNKNKERLDTRVAGNYKIGDFINQIYSEEQEDSIILFRLPDSMKNYLATLIQRIKKSLLKDLRMLIDDAEPTDEIVKAVMIEGAPNSDKEQY